MTQWYYVDKTQQRIGPMEATVLVDALRHGQLNLNSMVWQEGMPAWQPLSMHFDAIGVPESMRLRKQAKSGGAALWVIVAVVVGFIGIAILGILIAIALPAYNDYSLRAKLTEAIHESSAAKLIVVEHLAQHSECPNNNLTQSQLPAPESFASATVQTIDIAALDNGNCAVEVRVSDTLAPGQISGSIIHQLVEPQAQQWQCYSTTIKDKYLPANCRSGALGQ